MKPITISINGFSSTSGLFSLLLAEKGVKHKFKILDDKNSFSNLHPISNPIVNFKAQQIEKGFFNLYLFEKVIKITSFHFSWYDKNYNKVLHLEGNYKYPLYAIDNRIRYKLFWDKINENPNIQIEHYKTFTELINSEGCMLNFVGGGAKFNFLFDDFDQLYDVKNSKFKKTLFYFNLNAPNEILEKYTTTTAIYLEGNDYFILYTSLHVSKENVLTIVVNSNIFNNYTSFQQTFENIKDYISEIDKKIGEDLKKCELILENYRIGSFETYFKVPISKRNLIGLGETIFRVNPITGKGYNCSTEMINQLTQMVLSEKSSSKIIEDYKLYASKKFKELYYLNLAFTENQYNRSLTPVLVEAMNNKKLKSFAIAETYENTSLYFPWLINEKASEKLIQDYSKKKWYPSFLSFLFENRNYD